MNSEFSVENSEYYDLLKEASLKLIQLSKNDSLKDELLCKAPPVLWFGNLRESKERFLTIGANPSRKEFLNMSKKEAQTNLKKGLPLNYLKNGSIRLLTLGDNQNWENITKDNALKDKIINSYNNYFCNNPYANWFGKRNPNKLSYNVEGLINAMGASFYNNKEMEYQGIHIDLIPYVTISDFSEIIREEKNKNIILNNWTKEFLIKIIKRINPKYILVFGISNFEHFEKIMNIKERSEKKSFQVFHNNKIKKADFWSFKFNETTVIGLSLNVGNPIGWTKHTLNELGVKIKETLK